MASSGGRSVVELNAALSHRTNFSVGCYSENEAHCHRSLLRALLENKRAKILALERAQQRIMVRTISVT